jgi:hypothetical protein
MHLGFDAASTVLFCHLPHNGRPKYFEDCTASFRALAPGVSGFHNFAFVRGRMTAFALRAAIASWHLRES